MRSPLSLLQAVLGSPKSLSLSWDRTCSRLLISFVATCWKETLVFFYLESPKLDSAFQMWLHQGRVERLDHLVWPAAHVLFNEWRLFLGMSMLLALVYFSVLLKWFHIFKQDTAFDYQPGDAFCVICPNNVNEVEELLHILGLSEKGENFVCIKVKQDTKKKGKVWCIGYEKIFLSVIVVDGMHSFEHFKLGYCKTTVVL